MYLIFENIPFFNKGKDLKEMEKHTVKLNQVTQLLDEMIFKLPIYYYKEVDNQKFVDQVVIPRLNEIEKYLNSVQYTFMLGDQMTFPDIYVYLIDKLMKQLNPSVNEKFNKLTKLIERVSQDQRVKKFESSDQFNPNMNVCDPSYLELTYGIGI